MPFNLPLNIGNDRRRSPKSTVEGYATLVDGNCEVQLPVVGVSRPVAMRDTAHTTATENAGQAACHVPQSTRQLFDSRKRDSMFSLEVNSATL